jgi:hypothetical protein
VPEAEGEIDFARGADLHRGGRARGDGGFDPAVDAVGVLVIGGTLEEAAGGVAQSVVVEVADGRGAHGVEGRRVGAVLQLGTGFVHGGQVHAGADGGAQPHDGKTDEHADLTSAIVSEPLAESGESSPNVAPLHA